MRCLGLDIGSSSIKGAVLDLKRREVGSPISRPFPAPLANLPSGWFEVTPDEVVAAVRNVVEQLHAAAPDATKLFCSGQMGGLILVDADGAPLTNYISWRDQRTLAPFDENRSHLQEVRRRFDCELLRSLGNELQPGTGTSLLFWLRENGKLPASATPTTIGDFALGQLCGVRPGMHVTQAIGWLDGAELDWNLAALSAIGVNDLSLPIISAIVEPFGKCQVSGGKLTAYGTYGDQQCALRGAGLQRGELSINISTGSQVSRRATRFQPGNYQSRRYFDGDWLDTITHLPAGRSLNVLVDLLTEIPKAEGNAVSNPWPTISRLVDEASATDLEVDLAFFSGPLGSTGSVSKITTENLSVGQLFHAAFRTMAENYARVATRLDPDRSWKSAVISGGMTKSVPLLRRLIAERFPVPLRESAGEETLLGLLDIAREQP